METENGQAVYEADVVLDGKEVEVKVAADGTVLGKEADDEDEDDDADDADEEEDDEEDVQVSLADVPEAVKATILKRLPARRSKKSRRKPRMVRSSIPLRWSSAVRKLISRSLPMECSSAKRWKTKTTSDRLTLIENWVQ